MYPATTLGKVPLKLMVLQLHHILKFTEMAMQSYSKKTLNDPKLNQLGYIFIRSRWNV